MVGRIFTSSSCLASFVVWCYRPTRMVGGRGWRRRELEYVARDCEGVEEARRKSVAAIAPKKAKDSRRRLRWGAEYVVKAFDGDSREDHIRWSAIFPIEMTVRACKATEMEFTYRLKGMNIRKRMSCSTKFYTHLKLALSIHSQASFTTQR